MSHHKTADGKVNMHYEGVSYLCEEGDHENCGGICTCECHKRKP